MYCEDSFLLVVELFFRNTVYYLNMGRSESMKHAQLIYLNLPDFSGLAVSSILF